MLSHETKVRLGAGRTLQVCLRYEKQSVTFRRLSGLRRGEGPMARGAIRRFRYLVVSAIVLASAVLAGTANWPRG